MSIWSTQPDLVAINEMAEHSMVRHLDIRFVDFGEDYLTATMPVDRRTHQPMGLLHGGASVALAETLGSIGTLLCLDTERQYCVGLEINANHLRPVTQGRVTGTARPIHQGRTTQVWEIRIEDDGHRLVCVSRITLAVRDKAP